MQENVRSHKKNESKNNLRQEIKYPITEQRKSSPAPAQSYPLRNGVPPFRHLSLLPRNDVFERVWNIFVFIVIYLCQISTRLASGLLHTHTHTSPSVHGNSGKRDFGVGFSGRQSHIIVRPSPRPRYPSGSEFQHCENGQRWGWPREGGGKV